MVQPFSMGRSHAAAASRPQKAGVPPAAEGLQTGTSWAYRGNKVGHEWMHRAYSLPFAPNDFHLFLGVAFRTNEVDEFGILKVEFSDHNRLC